ncbi:hypothetical protein [Pandoraea pnomenusa]|uniref:hypothetical protein n=1 Tax=Pandoraea pnomenusa TaxID=93220 RepID=UPI00333EB31C
MSNGSTFTTMCGPGQQKVPRNSVAPEIAQLYALGLFRADFRRRYPAGETFSEWDLVGRTSVGTGKTAQDMVLRRIMTDFRNYYSKSQRNRNLIKSGTPASGLREGRSIRADGLGLGLDPIQRVIVAELLEVTTVDEADATIIEDIQPKVALLRGPIKTLVDRELAELRLNASVMLPEKMTAYGTPWVIPPDLAIVPIFQDVSTSAPSAYRWICFGPTYNYRPMPIPPFINGMEPEEAPARGLIAYSYHQTSSAQGVPEEVYKRFAAWARQQQRQWQRLELLPTPEVTRYWQDNNADLKKILAYAAVATLAVAIVVAAIYLAPIMIGSAQVYLTGLATAASVDALVANSAAIIAAISSAVPATLNFARTAMTAAANAGPQISFQP